MSPCQISAPWIRPNTASQLKRRNRGCSHKGRFGRSSRPTRNMLTPNSSVKAVMNLFSKNVSLIHQTSRSAAVSGSGDRSGSE